MVIPYSFVVSLHMCSQNYNSTPNTSLIPYSAHPHPHFLILQNRMLSFIWAYRSPRIAHSTPFTHRLWSGLGVPNLAKYYLAAQISQLALLHASNDTPLWVLLELPNCAPTLISTLLWLPHRLRPASSSPLFHSLQLCALFRKPYVSFATPPPNSA